MRWSANFAYAVGLITSDGCLSKDGRHIDFTSKDLEQIVNFKKILNLRTNIDFKSSGRGQEDRLYYRIQFGDVKLYRFLLSIGITPRKSKTLGSVKVPARYFRDYLRGHFDGDGSTNSYWDPRWKSSFMLYLDFATASSAYAQWLSKRIRDLFNIGGSIQRSINKNGVRFYQVRYAKYASLKLINKIYYKKGLICLKRKQFKIWRSLAIIAKQNADVVKWIYAQP